MKRADEPVGVETEDEEMAVEELGVEESEGEESLTEAV